jgi:hypothetical protein
MHYALIESNVVKHVLRVPPENIFPAQTAALYVTCPEDVEVGWTFADGEFAPPAPLPEPELSQFDRDQARYAKRAAVKDQLLAYMAADNMSRVRAGEWTVADLTSLLADPAVATANQFMNTLSFELAAQAIASASTPLLTPAIRADWIARLEAAFFTEV